VRGVPERKKTTGKTDLPRRGAGGPVIKNALAKNSEERGFGKKRKGSGTWCPKVSEKNGKGNVGAGTDGKGTN